MSNVYEAIKLLDSIEERTALRTFFINNPEKKAETELILSTCNDNEEVVALLKSLLKPVPAATVKVLTGSPDELY
ncbi:10540_t:CDS:2, partial [Paraglomus occultum]